MEGFQEIKYEDVQFTFIIDNICFSFNFNCFVSLQYDTTIAQVDIMRGQTGFRTTKNIVCTYYLSKPMTSVRRKHIS